MPNQQCITAALALIVLAGCGSHSSPPLWPGSKYTEADRSKAMLRALDYIDRSASDPANFAAQGSDYLYCFYSIAATASEPELRAAAARIAPGYARKWAAARSVIRPGIDQNELSDMIFGWLPASLIGESDA